MKRRTQLGKYVSIMAMCLALGSDAAFAENGKTAPEVSWGQVDAWVEELSNWGRWGKDDELGTLNLITPEKRVQAAALVKDGVTVSASRDVVQKKSPLHLSPLEHTVGKGSHAGADFAGDVYKIEFHGWSHSHIDALSHMFYKGTMYNGFSEDEVVVTDPDHPDWEVGARKLGINNMKNGIVSRGVLMDMPALFGVPYLEPGTTIMASDLEAWEKKAGVHVSEGDILLVRVGHWKYREAAGDKAIEETRRAGLHVSAVKWLKERGVAVIGSDGTSDVTPSGLEGYGHPVHMLVLHALGMPILDNMGLDDLAEEAGKRGRWEFLFTVAPLRIEGGTGSPINAIATF